MEEFLGRPLTNSEVVHHENGDKADNRIENLRLFASQADHVNHHSSLETDSERRQRTSRARGASLAAKDGDGSRVEVVR